MAKHLPIRSDKAPAPIGPYSQAIKSGGMIFCSGQVALGPNGDEALPDDVAEQAEQVMQNLAHVLGAAGASLADVVKTSIFLLDMADFAAVNAVYARHMALPYPARETVAVLGLPRGAKVEISCIAFTA